MIIKLNIFILLFSLGKFQAQQEQVQAPVTIASAIPPPNYQEEIFVTVEEAPQYPGGMAAMMRYMSSNVKYPTICRELGLSGKIFLRFIVDTTGAVYSVEVLKSSGSDILDKEALRAVNSMPVWSPGRQAGRAVKVYFTLPVSFKTQGDEKPFEFNANNNAKLYKTSIDKIKRGRMLEAEADLKEIPKDPDAVLLLALFAYDRDKEEAKRLFESITDNKKLKESDAFRHASHYLKEFYKIKN